MVKKQEEMKKIVVEHARGGLGFIEQLHFFQQEEMNTKNVKMFAKLTINPGNSIGEHSHDDDEEVIYVLKGKGTFYDNGVKKELLPGMAAITGGGKSHSIVNEGDEPLEFIALIVK